MIVPPHSKDPFRKIPTIQGWDPGIASLPPAILEEPLLVAIFFVPHILLAVHFTRKTALVELIPFCLHSSTSIGDLIEP